MGTRGQGNTETGTRRHGDARTREHGNTGDTETREHGYGNTATRDKGTGTREREHGDTGTRGHGNTKGR